MSAASRRSLLHRRLPAVQSCFYRGGTSRGLVFKNTWLGLYSPADREAIITSMMGSPDPDGRQINGMGGGASSLSKSAIVSISGSRYDRRLRAANVAMPGPALAETMGERQVKSMSDVVYRFGQVSIKEPSIDWGSTCGNMVAAVAHFAIEQGMLYKRSMGHLPSVGGSLAEFDDTLRRYTTGELKDRVTVRILAHDTGNVVRASVPVQPHLRQTDENGDAGIVEWIPMLEGSAQIAGVPGTAPGIVIETPLVAKGKPFSPKAVLSTGNERDSIEVDGVKLDVSIVDTGLPVIFVDAQSIGVSSDVLRQSPDALDADRPLMEKLERIRHAASQLTPELAAKFSPPAPKICLIHAPVEYTTTGGVMVKANEMDLLIRTVSVGQLHRTVPATTLSAIASAQCYANSVVKETLSKYRQAHPSTMSAVPTATQSAIDEISLVREDEAKTKAGRGRRTEHSIHAITVGQPAGLSTACVLADKEGGFPRAAVMIRTAKRICNVFAPPPTGISHDPEIVQLIQAYEKENKDNQRLKRLRELERDESRRRVAALDEEMPEEGEVNDEKVTTPTA